MQIVYYYIAILDFLEKKGKGKEDRQGERQECNVYRWTRRKERDISGRSDGERRRKVEPYWVGP